MFEPFIGPLPVDRICGLCPEIWLSVGAGFAREDIKALVLSQKRGFTGDAILNLQELCLKLTGISSDQILNSHSRQEVLRMLLSEPRIASQMPEIRRIKRQRNFLRRLDTAMQTGRISFAHPQEEEVYSERLLQALGANPLRDELRLLTRAYEAWLEASSWMDLPLLIKTAIQTLQPVQPLQQRRLESVRKPQEIWVLSIQNPESLEREFWELLGQTVPIRWVQGVGELPVREPQLEWQKWHTLDDAAESFADEILETVGRTPFNEFDWDSTALLLPDIPSVRRSLRRALESRGIPVADPRDPTRLRWDESLKWALMPLEVVGRNYERHKTIAWLRGVEAPQEFPQWVEEFSLRGIRHGLASYSGGKLAAVYSKLSELEAALGGKKTCQEIAESHLKLLKVSLDPHYSFFEGIWEGFKSDMARVGLEKKRAPLLFWLEKLQARLREASPPVERLKPRTGLRIYRLQQALVKSAKQVWILGLPQSWLNGDGAGSYWFSEREREILASEFAVRSSVQVREERLRVLLGWIKGCEKVTVLDSHYDSGGREQESILPFLKEIELGLGVSWPEEPIERGSHPRFTRSYGAVRPIQPQVLQLSPVLSSGAEVPQMTATALDRYTRCSFQALAYHRWKLRDIREPDSELWPDVRGNILHEAVRLLLATMDSAGHFKLLPREALELAWKKKRPMGLVRGERIESYVKFKLCLTLEIFCEKEREYFQRAGARPVSLDNLSFQLKYPDFTVVGQPDRIDLHTDGYFIMDYKSSGSVPHGSEMIEQGYRLQLPFYALAASKESALPVIGLQFIELDKRGGRKNGVFFKSFNGKEKGKLTSVRSNSKSLVNLSPDETWNIFEEHIVQSVRSFILGKFEAKPRTVKRESECARCAVGDLCGHRRLLPSETTPLGSGT